MTTLLGHKAIVIICNRDGAVGSYLLEYSTPQELDLAIAAIGQWAGYHEIIRLDQLEQKA